MDDRALLRGDPERTCKALLSDRQAIAREALSAGVKLRLSGMTVAESQQPPAERAAAEERRKASLAKKREQVKNMMAKKKRIEEGK
jgi:hypothetical protein